MFTILFRFFTAEIKDANQMAGVVDMSLWRLFALRWRHSFPTTNFTEAIDKDINDKRVRSGSTLIYFICVIVWGRPQNGS